MTVSRSRSAQPAAGNPPRPFERLVRALLYHRRAALTAIALVTLVLASQIARLRVHVDVNALLPPHHPFVVAEHKIEALFGGKNWTSVAFFPDDGNAYSPRTLGLVRDLTQRIEGLSGARNVLSLGARKAFYIAGAGDSVVVDPILSDRELPAEAVVRERVARSPLFTGTVVSASGNAANILFEFTFNDRTRDAEALRAHLEGFIDGLDTRGVRVLLGGHSMMEAALSAYSRQLLAYFAVAVAVIGLVHWEAFRTLQGLVIPLCTALLSVVWGVGLMGAVGVHLDPFNAITPILILAIAAGHSVQVLKRYYEEFEATGDNLEAVVRSTVATGPVMILAGLVASISFLSLLTFDMPTIRSFGVFTALGILSAVAIEMTFIPCVRSLLAAPARGGARAVDSGPVAHAFTWFLERVALRAATDRAAAALVVLACLGAASALLARRVEIENASRNYFSAGDPVLANDRLLNDHFAGTYTLQVLVHTRDRDGVLKPGVMRPVAALAQSLETIDGVGRALSFADILSTMHYALQGDVETARVVPESSGLIAQLALLYESSGANIDTMVDASGRNTLIRVLTRDDSTHFARRLIEAVGRFAETNFPPGTRVRIGGTIATDVALNELMVSGKLRNILQVMAVIFVCGTVVFRSLWAGSLVVVPLVVSVLLTFAAMGALGIKLDVGTVTIAALAVGLGADYSIYFLYRLREEARRARYEVAVARALETSGRAVLYVATAIMTGYLTLCLSGFALHRRIGGLFAWATAVAACATLTVVPAVCRLVRPAFVFRQQPPAVDEP